MNFYDNLNNLSGGQLPPIPFKGGEKGFSWGNVPNLPKIPTNLSDLPAGLSALQSGLSNLPDGWSDLPRALNQWCGGLSNLPGGLSNFRNLPPFVSGRLPEGLRGSYNFTNRLLKGDVVGPPGFHPAKSSFRVSLVH
ncbi:hypothetical protein GE061_008930 [Apolygus lucorum]|uniref:Uncharacterized protein n=1 Tax=Apolygus lucorum TaxID=248454 RepID=A0A6A4JTJ5_APOLU|nr:hypothetical protein GE061_008930 [Apolygus lucorum]